MRRMALTSGNDATGQKASMKSAQQRAVDSQRIPQHVLIIGECPGRDTLSFFGPSTEQGLWKWQLVIDFVCKVIVLRVG